MSHRKAPSKQFDLRSANAVRISVPASIAYDIGAFQESIGVLAERLGHPTCFSGVDCTFLLERDLLVNEKGRVRSAEQPRLAAGASEGNLLSSRPITARMPAKVSYDLELVHESVANIAGMLGCPECTSGFDITFWLERDYLVNADGTPVPVPW